MQNTERAILHLLHKIKQYDIAETLTR